MSFWSTQRIKAEQKKQHLVEPFNEERIQQGAYEMTLSRQVITTPDSNPSATAPGNGAVLKIPPGQFALLYSEEKVSIPANVIAFISIKASVKLDGLVNISGFHVDPGFVGRLKYSVYNAGNLPIFLEYGRSTFLIWFAEFDSATEDPYTGSHKNQDRITPKDRQRMAEETHSPAALDRRLEKVERKFIWLFTAATTITTVVLLPLLVVLLQNIFQAKAPRCPAPRTHTLPAALQVPTPRTTISAQPNVTPTVENSPAVTPKP